ncbi:MAG: oxygen-insensitive NADPH nitroreductase [Gammaproteobacteria bacterium]|nr:oxygen-insensitive NADPH nitroreductase [Gammaproteobacteria bacterium]
MNDVTRLLKSHRSIRKFTEETVSREIVEELVACGQAAATSSNVQAVTVIHVTDPDKRDALATHAGGQRYVSTAGAFLVYCADMNRPRYACERQQGVYAAGMTEQFIIATVDVALAAQNAVVAAESLGLGICYIGGLRNNPAEVSQLLALPEHVYPVFGLCLGYPAQDPEIKPRLPVPAVLMENEYDNSGFDANIDRYDSEVQHYYMTRTGGNKDSTWSQEMKSLVGKESRPHMYKFLQSRGFLQK